MDLAGLIDHLKANVPSLGGRVAGAADFATGLEDQVWMPSPSAYVVPLDEEAAANDEMNALQQVITERVGVIVLFDNSPDRRGQTSTLLYAPMRTALFSALLNWRGLDPNHAVRGLEAAGGRLLDMNRARLFYQWDFSLETIVTDADGWQVDAPPLLSITGNDQTAYPGAPLPAFRVDLPQT